MHPAYEPPAASIDPQYYSRSSQPDAKRDSPLQARISRGPQGFVASRLQIFNSCAKSSQTHMTESGRNRAVLNHSSLTSRPLTSQTSTDRLTQATLAQYSSLWGPALAPPKERSEFQEPTPEAKSPAYLSGKNPYGQFLEKHRIPAGPPSHVGSSIEGRFRQRPDSLTFPTRPAPESNRMAAGPHSPTPSQEKSTLNKDTSKSVSVKATKDFWEGKAASTQLAPPLRLSTLIPTISKRQESSPMKERTSANPSAPLPRPSEADDYSRCGHGAAESQAFLQKNLRNILPVSSPPTDAAEPTKYTQRANPFTRRARDSRGPSSLAAAAGNAREHETQAPTFRRALTRQFNKELHRDAKCSFSLSSSAQAEDGTASRYRSANAFDKPSRTVGRIGHINNSRCAITQPREAFAIDKTSTQEFVLAASGSRRSPHYSTLKPYAPKEWTKPRATSPSEFDQASFRSQTTRGSHSVPEPVYVLAQSKDGTSSEDSGRPPTQPSYMSAQACIPKISEQLHPPSDCDIPIPDHVDDRGSYGRRKTQDFGFPGAHTKINRTVGQKIKIPERAGSWTKYSCGHFIQSARNATREEASSRVCEACLAKIAGNAVTAGASDKPSNIREHMVKYDSDGPDDKRRPKRRSVEGKARCSSLHRQCHAESIPSDKCGESFAIEFGHLIDTILIEHGSLLNAVIRSIDSSKPSPARSEGNSEDVVQIPYDTVNCMPYPLPLDHPFDPVDFYSSSGAVCPDVPPQAAEALNVGRTGQLGPNLNDPMSAVQEVTRSVEELIGLLKSAADDFGVDLEEKPDETDDQQFESAPVEGSVSSPSLPLPSSSSSKQEEDVGKPDEAFSSGKPQEQSTHFAEARSRLSLEFNEIAQEIDRQSDGQQRSRQASDRLERVLARLLTRSSCRFSERKPKPLEDILTNISTASSTYSLKQPDDFKSEREPLEQTLTIASSAPSRTQTQSRPSAVSTRIKSDGEALQSIEGIAQWLEEAWNELPAAIESIKTGLNYLPTGESSQGPNHRHAEQQEALAEDFEKSHPHIEFYAQPIPELQIEIEALEIRPFPKVISSPPFSSDSESGYGDHPAKEEKPEQSVRFAAPNEMLKESHVPIFGMTAQPPRDSCLSSSVAEVVLSELQAESELEQKSMTPAKEPTGRSSMVVSGTMSAVAERSTSPASSPRLEGLTRRSNYLHPTCRSFVVSGQPTLRTAVERDVSSSGSYPSSSSSSCFEEGSREENGEENEKAIVGPMVQQQTFVEIEPKRLTKVSARRRNILKSRESMTKVNVPSLSSSCFTAEVGVDENKTLTEPETLERTYCRRRASIISKNPRYRMVGSFPSSSSSEEDQIPLEKPMVHIPRRLPTQCVVSKSLCPLVIPAKVTEDKTIDLCPEQDPDIEEKKYWEPTSVSGKSTEKKSPPAFRGSTMEQMVSFPQELNVAEAQPIVESETEIEFNINSRKNIRRKSPSLYHPSAIERHLSFSYELTQPRQELRPDFTSPEATRHKRSVVSRLPSLDWASEELERESKSQIIPRRISKGKGFMAPPVPIREIERVRSFPFELQSVEIELQPQPAMEPIIALEPPGELEHRSQTRATVNPHPEASRRTTTGSTTLRSSQEPMKQASWPSLASTLEGYEIAQDFERQRAITQGEDSNWLPRNRSSDEESETNAVRTIQILSTSRQFPLECPIVPRVATPFSKPNAPKFSSPKQDRFGFRSQQKIGKVSTIHRPSSEPVVASLRSIPAPMCDTSEKAGTEFRAPSQRAKRQAGGIFEVPSITPPVFACHRETHIPLPEAVAAALEDFSLRSSSPEPVGDIIAISSCGSSTSVIEDFQSVHSSSPHERSGQTWIRQRTVSVDEPAFRGMASKFTTELLDETLICENDLPMSDSVFQEITSPRQSIMSAPTMSRTTSSYNTPSASSSVGSDRNRMINSPKEPGLREDISLDISSPSRAMTQQNVNFPEIREKTIRSESFPSSKMRTKRLPQRYTLNKFETEQSHVSGPSDVTASPTPSVHSSVLDAPLAAFGVYNAAPNSVVQSEKAQIVRGAEDVEIEKEDAEIYARALTPQVAMPKPKASAREYEQPILLSPEESLPGKIRELSLAFDDTVSSPDSFRSVPESLGRQATISVTGTPIVEPGKRAPRTPTVTLSRKPTHCGSPLERVPARIEHSVKLPAQDPERRRKRNKKSDSTEPRAHEVFAKCYATAEGLLVSPVADAEDITWDKQPEVEELDLAVEGISDLPRARQLSAAAAPVLVGTRVYNRPRNLVAVPPEEQYPPAPAYPIRDTPSWTKADVHEPPQKPRLGTPEASKKRRGWLPTCGVRLKEEIEPRLPSLQQKDRASTDPPDEIVRQSPLGNQSSNQPFRNAAPGPATGSAPGGTPQRTTCNPDSKGQGQQHIQGQIQKRICHQSRAQSLFIPKAPTPSRNQHSWPVQGQEARHAWAQPETPPAYRRRPCYDGARESDSKRQRWSDAVQRSMQAYESAARIAQERRTEEALRQRQSSSGDGVRGKGAQAPETDLKKGVAFPYSGNKTQGHERTQSGSRDSTSRGRSTAEYPEPEEGTKRDDCSRTGAGTEGDREESSRKQHASGTRSDLQGQDARTAACRASVRDRAPRQSSNRKVGPGDSSGRILKAAHTLSSAPSTQERTRKGSLFQGPGTQEHSAYVIETANISEERSSANEAGEERSFSRGGIVRMDPVRANTTMRITTKGSERDPGRRATPLRIQRDGEDPEGTTSKKEGLKAMQPLSAAEKLGFAKPDWLSSRITTKSNPFWRFPTLSLQPEATESGPSPQQTGTGLVVISEEDKIKAFPSSLIRTSTQRGTNGSGSVHTTPVSGTAPSGYPPIV